MESISMTAKELVVLAAKLGASTFYGVSDPFRGMSRGEIRAELPELQQQSEARGLARIGFDESFQVKEEVSELINPCAMCERYVVIDAVDAGRRRLKEILYGKEKNCVLLRKFADGAVELQKITVENYRKIIMSKFFMYSMGENLQSGSIMLRHRWLKDWNESGADNIQQLIEIGCPADMAVILQKGIHRQCTYLSMVRVDLQENSCVTLQCLTDPSGRILLKSTNEDGEEFCNISWLCDQDAIGEMDKLFHGF